MKQPRVVSSPPPSLWTCTLYSGFSPPSVSLCVGNDALGSAAALTLISLLSAADAFQKHPGRKATSLFSPTRPDAA